MSLIIKSPNITYTRPGLFSAWTPDFLTSDLLGWWRADAGATTDATPRLTALVDQSGKGIDLAGGTNPPAFIADDQNGKPGWWNDTFATTGRAMQAAVAGSPFDSAFSASQPVTVGVVFRHGFIGGAISAGIMGQGMANTNTPQWALGAGNKWSGALNRVGFGIANSFDGGGTILEGCIAAGSTILVDTKRYIIVASYDGSGSTAGIKIWINGVAETMISFINNLATAISLSGGFQLGVRATGGQSNKYTYNEAVLYKRALNATEVGKLSSYFNQRWAIY
jgi:hypothetical protein